MIEAVNSVLSNASLSRGAAEQQSASRSYAANPEKIQESARVPYISNYISVDAKYQKAVLQIRDSDTGDVVRQFPTESQLKAYRTAQEFVDRAEQLKSEDTTTPVLNTAPRAQETSAPELPGAPTVPAAGSVSTEA
ncbi:MAG: hypothetical protein CMH31_05765 [Micavibrio sp.]|nr:hypothetical protein [Micavibrio sp.]